MMLIRKVSTAKQRCYRCDLIMPVGTAIVLDHFGWRHELECLFGATS